MKYRHLFFLAIQLIPCVVFGIAENSHIDYVSYIVSREGGYHAIFLESSSLQNTDACTRNDRAVLVNTEGENRAMYTLALSAMLTGARVQLRTDGCVPLQAGSASTAPRLVKVKLFAP